ncbi:hypothetical protein I553_3948 [Mycobacterium xenopi 4042]|uniref:Uncharacterized protein n=1 Tax=Mycobacterium xenopi 4042 TaxID=1299334 RepID=X8ANU2_MYCXE|nr:hypothetical protein I553_3948 [Mycobacterium xenopi 4042]
MTVTPATSEALHDRCRGRVYDAAGRRFGKLGCRTVEMGMGARFRSSPSSPPPSRKRRSWSRGRRPATQAHSVNESLHLGVLEKAAAAEALLLANLGASTV